MAENIINEDRIKLNKYNEHITSLEDLLKSVTIKGNYEQLDAGTICEYAEHINEGIDLNYQRKYNKDKFLLIKEINSMVEIFYNRFKDTYANNILEEITF